jgi:hypothetical protein
VRPHHSESLLDAEVQGPRMRPETCSPRARKRLASELPACASPSSMSWQVSRAAERSSSSSCSEEL